MTVFLKLFLKVTPLVKLLWHSEIKIKIFERIGQFLFLKLQLNYWTYVRNRDSIDNNLKLLFVQMHFKICKIKEIHAIISLPLFNIDTVPEAAAANRLRNTGIRNVWYQSSGPLAFLAPSFAVWEKVW